jgi:pimeloyl-ACP methyl ester carboxylesterase
MPSIHANGLDVGYEVVGDGPPLIALHGATGSGRDHLAPQLAVLASRFRVFLPDARGHGTTRWDVTRGLATTDLASDVVSFADALGLDRFHLLGYSMGGMTALHVAVDHGARLTSLAVVSIAPEREPRLAVGRRLMDPVRIERDDPVWAAQLRARHDPVQGDAAWRRLLDAIVRDIAEQPLLEPKRLRDVRIPTLVAAGDRDPFVPVSAADGLARQVAIGQLLIVPGVGHDALATRPAVLQAALAAHYRSIGIEEARP